jgi:DNA-directed RNA polymerase subunit M/transcription elongation factor TFIIS
MNTHTKARCPQCGSPETLRVDLTVQAAPVAFTTCARCEARWWERDGSSVPLQAVLQEVGRR